MGNVGNIHNQLALPGASPSSSPGVGVVVSNDGDKKTSFKDAWSEIQAKMGEKPKQPRVPKKSLDKDDFLKIMVTQMKHQDPTKPFDAERMATELAQITSVEQLKNMNTKLDKISVQNRPLEQLGMTSLIGKIVTVDKNKFNHAKGEPETISYALPEKAKEVKITIISDTGETVFEKEVGSADAGANQFTWNGKKNEVIDTNSGSYMFMIQAKNANGNVIPTSLKMRGRIIGVSFEGKEPSFLIGDAFKQEKVGLSNVTAIENEGMNTGTAAAPSGNAGGGITPILPQQQGGQSSPRFFTFEKGVGSKDINPNQLDAAAAQALAQYQAGQAAQGKQAGQAPQVPSEEQGFPNGLSEAGASGGDRIGANNNLEPGKEVSGDE